MYIKVSSKQNAKLYDSNYKFATNLNGMASRVINLFLTIFIINLCNHCATAQTCTDFVESTTCGGNIVADSGIIRYNHSGYGDNTGCMWLIRSNINSKIEVRLLEDTFSSNQNIQIYRMFMDGEIGGNGDSSIRHGQFNARYFDGPIILVTFSTFKAAVKDDNPTPSFTLLFRGCGPDIANSPTFTHHYRERVSGETEVVTYPEDGEIYPNNQLVTYLGLRQDRALLMNISDGEWKVKVTYQDIQPSSYCLFADSLKFYGGGFNFLSAVDEQNEFIDRFCQRDSNVTHILPMRSPKYGNSFPDKIGIIGVFSSNAYQGGKGFVFE